MGSRGRVSAHWLSSTTYGVCLLGARSVILPGNPAHAQRRRSAQAAAPPHAQLSADRWLLGDSPAPARAHRYRPGPRAALADPAPDDPDRDRLLHERLLQGDGPAVARRDDHDRRGQQSDVGPLLAELPAGARRRAPDVVVRDTRVGVALPAARIDARDAQRDLVDRRLLPRRHDDPPGSVVVPALFALLLRALRAVGTMAGKMPSDE